MICLANTPTLYQTKTNHAVYYDGQMCTINADDYAKDAQNPSLLLISLTGGSVA